MLKNPLEECLIADERLWLDRVVANLADLAEKRVYADWLEDQGDPRAEFLRQFANATVSMAPDDFPAAEGLPDPWLEMLGYPLLKHLAALDLPQCRDLILNLARPALRTTFQAIPEDQVPVGASKIGGYPDLPTPDAWLIGKQCNAIYNDSTESYDQLACFMAQVNLAEIANTYAAKDLPKTGLLSFFCFQDWEDDNPDAVGVGVVYFPETATLRRIDPPQELTAGNEIMESSLLEFEETMDLPESYDGPWSNDYGEHRDDLSELLDHVRERNFYNMLGYGRATTGADPTPDRDSRHLILLSNSYACRMHIQIPQRELTNVNFDAITLDWVDFD